MQPESASSGVACLPRLLPRRRAEGTLCDPALVWPGRGPPAPLLGKQRSAGASGGRNWAWGGCAGLEKGVEMGCKGTGASLPCGEAPHCAKAPLDLAQAPSALPNPAQFRILPSDPSLSQGLKHFDRSWLQGNPGSLCCGSLRLWFAHAGTVREGGANARFLLPWPVRVSPPASSLS